MLQVFNEPLVRHMRFQPCFLYAADGEVLAEEVSVCWNGSIGMVLHMHGCISVVLRFNLNAKIKTILFVW